MIPGIVAGKIKRQVAPVNLSGYIMSAAAGAGSGATSRSSLRTDLPTWQANFGATINEGLFGSALTAPGDTGVLPTKTIGNFSIGHTLKLACNSAAYVGDTGVFTMEFLNGSGSVVAAIVVDFLANFQLRMRYGPSTASLTEVPRTGTSIARVTGDLTFNSTTMSFTPTAATNDQSAWSMTGDFASVVSTRISNARAKSGSSDGGPSAYSTIFRSAG